MPFQARRAAVFSHRGSRFYGAKQWQSMGITWQCEWHSPSPICHITLNIQL